MSELAWTDLLGKRFDSANQAFLTRWFSQRLGSLIAASAFRVGASPNMVTLIGLPIMLVACVPYVVGGGPAAWVLAAVLWQIGFGFDCADGQLARATETAGSFGAWLDVACDHVRMSAQTLAVLAVFVQANVPTGYGLLVAFVLLSGMSVYLHTATFMKSGDARVSLTTTGVAGLVRLLLRTLLDTPLFLLVLCLLRPWPRWLMLYCVIYGLLTLLRGVALGRRRLQG